MDATFSIRIWISMVCVHSYLDIGTGLERLLETNS